MESEAELRQIINTEISQNDVYQMISYAVKRGVSDVYLLYPLYRFEDCEPYFPVNIVNQASGETIKVHMVRLPFVFENDIKSVKTNLTKTINKIFD